MLPSSSPSIDNSLYKLKYGGKYKFNPNASNLLTIDTYDHLTDKVHVVGVVDTNLNSLHPMVTDTAWIRGAPEGGTVLASGRSDNKDMAITNYQTVDPHVRIKQYYNGNGFYRPLYAGEIEIHSKGLAQSFYSRFPVLEHKAGFIRQWLDQNRLTLGAKAPCHQRICHDKVAGVMGDEERFGIVKRYKDNSTLLENYFDISSDTPSTNGNFNSGWAKEYLRVLNNALGKLEDLRIGDVIDDEGTFQNLSRTGNPLRYRHEIFMEGAEDSVLTQIDNKGNMDITFPATVDKIDFINAGKEIAVRTKNDYNFVSDEGHFKVRVKESSMFECKKFGVGSANEKAVLGNQLKSLLLAILNALISHTHTGNLGVPTTTPITGLVELQNALNTVNSDSLFSDFIFFAKAAS